jgi:hypothetical protein
MKNSLKMVKRLFGESAAEDVIYMHWVMLCKGARLILTLAVIVQHNNDMPHISN